MCRNELRENVADRKHRLDSWCATSSSLFPVPGWKRDRQARGNCQSSIPATDNLISIIDSHVADSSLSRRADNRQVVTQLMCDTTDWPFLCERIVEIRAASVHAECIYVLHNPLF